MGFLDNTGLERLWMHIIAKLGEKVNKEDGKGLSANDYTTEEKNKLASIEEGANKIVVDETLADSTNPVQNKVVNDAISNLNTLIGDTSVSAQITAAIAAIDYPVDSVNGKTGVVVLSASDVGALPATTVIPSIEGLASETYVGEAIVAHNTDEAAHEDIRTAISAAAAEAKAYTDERVTSAKDGIVLKDQVNGYNYVLCMRDGELVTYCATESIEVTTMPTKTSYMAGDVFDTTGMVVTATAYNRTTKEVTDITASTEPLTETTKEVEVNYTEAGIVHSTGVPVSVREFDPTIDLVDFEYTDNGDGTYTLTAWKGTYQGEPSTELIVPNISAVIV